MNVLFRAGLLLPLLMLGHRAFAALSEKSLGADITEPVQCLPTAKAEAAAASDVTTVYPEQLCIGALKGLAKRNGRVLELALDGGKSKSFKDRPVAPNCANSGCPLNVSYKLIGFYPKHRIYVVRAFYSEAIDDIITSLAYEQELDLGAVAHFSPSGDLIAGVEEQSPMPSSAGITIVDLTAFPLQKVFSIYNHDAWQFVGWNGDKMLKVKTVEGEISDYIYNAEITLSGSVWRLHPAYK